MVNRSCDPTNLEMANTETVIPEHNKMTDTTSDPDNHQMEKRFNCSLCSYKSISKSLLQLHQRVHSEEKPFSCQLCPYSCKQKSSLSAHIKTTHLGEKPYNCHQCSFRSGKSSSLKIHLRIHSGEKINVSNVNTLVTTPQV